MIDTRLNAALNLQRKSAIRQGGAFDIRFCKDHTSGVLQLLEQQRERRQLPVPMTGALSEKAREQTPFTPTSLQSYEPLHQVSENDGDIADTTEHSDSNRTNT